MINHDEDGDEDHVLGGDHGANGPNGPSTHLHASHLTSRLIAPW